MTMSSRGLRCMAAVLLIGAAPTVAMAYIDPGNGAYMVQVLFTLIGAAIFYLRHPIQSLKAVWRWIVDRRKDKTVTSVQSGPAVASTDDAGISSGSSAAVRDSV